MANERTKTAADDLDWLDAAISDAPAGATEPDYGADDSDEWDEEDDGELRRRARGEGARLAYGALKRVLADPRATSQALATSARTMLQAGGYLERIEDVSPGKQLHEMTAEELEAQKQWLFRRQRVLLEAR